MNKLKTSLVAVALVVGSLFTLPGCGEDAGPGQSQGSLEPLETLDGADEALDLGKEDAGGRTLPAFDDLWTNYPNGEAEEVKALIGGNVNADWITNTCTIRLSRALNYSGFAVPRTVPGLSTVRGGDSKRYAFRVAEFRRYLRATLGKPAIEVTALAPGAGVDRSAFIGQRGVIVFEVTGWSDATGHVDLWDGTMPAHAEYFAMASKVQLWPAR